MNLDKRWREENGYPLNPNYSKSLAEFYKVLNEAKGEIMAVAIQTTKQAMFVERLACAQMLLDMADADDEGTVCTALRDAANQLINRIPAQHQ